MRLPLRADNLQDPLWERPRDERMPAQGEVILYIFDPKLTVLLCRLVNVSKQGFRASHNHRSLSAGNEVHFVHSGVEGCARVMWTRIEGTKVESGFLILKERKTQ